MEEDYVPSEEILEKYADVMVNFALNQGQGIKKGEVVEIVVPEYAKPILKPLYKKVIQAGGHPILRFIPDDVETVLYEYGTDEQISFFPREIAKGKIKTINHLLGIVGDKNPKALSNIDPKKIMMAQASLKEYKKWRDEKENKGEFSWAICLYASHASAKEAGLTYKEYWEQIINACYLNEKNPVKKWKEIATEIQRVAKTLTDMEIDKVHIEAQDTDIWVNIGEHRKWLGASGHNIPSFEVFTSPDWRGTNGYIQFTEPLYRHGNLIKNVRLEFKDGEITKFSATENEELLAEIIAQENANKIGEFSLTDGRISNITKFMAETLYDENVGGKYGNTHLAIGNSYDDTYSKGPENLTDEIRKELGFNKSIIHMDIVATTKRTVTAYIKDGSEKVIYKDGKFLI